MKGFVIKSLTMRLFRRVKIWPKLRDVIFGRPLRYQDWMHSSDIICLETKICFSLCEQQKKWVREITVLKQPSTCDSAYSFSFSWLKHSFLEWIFGWNVLARPSSKTFHLVFWLKWNLHEVDVADRDWRWIRVWLVRFVTMLQCPWQTDTFGGFLSRIDLPLTLLQSVLPI